MKIFHGFALLALLVPALAVASGQMPGAKVQGQKAASALAVLHVARQKTHGCEPIAPIETRLLVGETASLGSRIPLQMEGILTDFSAPATMRIDLPAGIRLVSGKATDKGTMEKGKPYNWGFEFVVDQPANYEITVQIIAGNKDYEFGQRRTLYVDLVNGAYKLSTERPKVPPVLQQDPYPATQYRGEPVHLEVRQRGVPPEAAFTGKFDPYGKELDPPTGGLTDATTTVTGIWRYRHTDSTLHAGYGSWVEAWDDDTTTADDFLGRDTADGSGNFSITFDNTDDLGFGTSDVYIVFISENTRIEVHNSGATSGYRTATGVNWPNILGGTVNVGSWYADWGTNGVSDSNERAFQCCDDLTTAWQQWAYYTGILFDNRLTHCQWYIGSTDGSYYVIAENRIYFEDSDVSSPDVLMHEYGHSMHDGLFSDIQWPPGTGGPHSFTGHYTTGLAWTEGFATYYSCTAQANNWIYNSYDPGNLITFDCDSNWDGNGSANGNSDGLSNSPNWGYDTESAVLSFQLDIDDSRNSTTDPYDWCTLGDDEIFNVMRNYTTGGHRPYSVQEFFDGWHSINDVLNPQINGLMHNHGMEQSIGFPTIGLYDGVNRYSGTWYYGGYGRGSYDIKNYSSEAYDLNQCYVWLRGPANEDVGQLGGDGNGTPLASGATRNVWKTTDQVGNNQAAPNFIYGNYTITAGFYRSDGAWQLLEPAEVGTDRQITVPVVQDTSGPPSCAVQDDGANQVSLSAIHITAQSNDPESSIDGYWTRVGSSAGAGNYQDWVFHPANNVTNWDYTITGLAIPAGSVAYVTVVSQNIYSTDSPFAYTDGIRCGDTTPPGAVSVTDDGQFNPRTDTLHYSTTTTEPDGGILMWWSRLGTTLGSGNAQDWISYDVHTLTFDNTLTGLSLQAGSMYFVTSVARNYGIQDTFGYSNGILAPLFPDSYTLLQGTYFGGSLASLNYSDNDRLTILCDEIGPNAEVLLKATSPVAGGATMYANLETRATRTDMVQFVYAYNYSTASWTTVDTRVTTIADQSIIKSWANAEPYIDDASSQVQARIVTIPFQDLEAGDGWTVSIDRYNWYIAP